MNPMTMTGPLREITAGSAPMTGPRPSVAATLRPLTDRAMTGPQPARNLLEVEALRGWTGLVPADGHRSETSRNGTLDPPDGSAGSSLANSRNGRRWASKSAAPERACSTF